MKEWLTARGNRRRETWPTCRIRTGVQLSAEAPWMERSSLCAAKAGAVARCMEYKYMILPRWRRLPMCRNNQADRRRAGLLLIW